ncbi:HXXEE domain-containing protein [Parabacteroides distasonis]|nr:HXXEE domain-containing protein [Parabacteroides distasonis]
MDKSMAYISIIQTQSKVTLQINLKTVKLKIMNELELIVSLFPIVFMLHEFEEIIGFKPWVVKDGLWIAKKFPKAAKQITLYERLSVPAFALAVLEEFVLVGLVTVLALTLQWYSAWIAVFMGFSLHILMHIGQWIVVGKYIPIAVTSLLSLPYIVWEIYKIYSQYSISMIVFCFIIGTIVLIVNLRFVHKLALQFDKRIKA